MYSEHGFDARIRPPAGQVCQSFMVVLKCRPGSADDHAAKPIFSQRSRALTVFTVSPVVRESRCQSSSASTARRKVSVIEIVLFEFWPETVSYASDCQSTSKTGNSMSL
jgi:hypothetical protein